MKQVREAIHVQSRGGQPQRLFWRGGVYDVIGVEDCWRYASKWWIDGKGWRRAYFCVTARPVGRSGAPVSFEMYRQGGHWILHRVLD
jgi:hypothetical protein